jgi:hypothetical protein
LEIGSPGDKGDPRNFAFSIGHATKNNGFVPCLSVAADCTVTVHGALEIGGQLLEGPVAPDPQDPRFQAAVVNTWTGGIGTAAGLLNTVIATALQVSIPPTLVTPLGPLTYRVDVANAGSGTVTDIHLYVVLAIGGTVVQRAEIALATRVLQAGETVSPEHPTGITVSQGGVVDLAATAIGLGPAGNPVQASTRARFTSNLIDSPG